MEFALTLPIFLLLLLATIDFGRAALIWVTVENAAREGARYAIIAPTDTAGIQAAAKSKAVLISNDPLSVNASCSTSGCPDGSPILVQVQYQFHPLTGFITQAVGLSSITMTAGSRMLIE